MDTNRKKTLGYFFYLINQGHDDYEYLITQFLSIAPLRYVYWYIALIWFEYKVLVIFAFPYICWKRKLRTISHKSSRSAGTRPKFTYSRSRLETLEQCVESVQI